MCIRDSLTSDGTAPGDPETLAKIVAKTPTDALEFPEETLATIAEEGVEAKNRVFIDPSKVSIAILACANNSSSDIAGVSFELIKSLLGRAHSGGKNNFLSFFSFLIEEVAIFTLQHVQADKSYYTIYNITACFWKHSLNTLERCSKFFIDTLTSSTKSLYVWIYIDDIDVTRALL